MRYLVQATLPQLVVALPVCHDRIVELARSTELFVKHHVADSGQRIGNRREPSRRPARGVVLRTTVHAVLASFHAALDAHGQRRQTRPILHERLGVLVEQNERAENTQPS